MSATVVWDGLDELRADLRALPEVLTDRASTIITGAANTTADRLRAVYPDGPMKDKVAVTVDANRFGTVATVKSPTKQATWWEYGTQIRRTQKGFSRGAEPSHYQTGLVSIAQTERRQMNGDLRDLVVEAGAALGFEVQMS